MSRRRPRKKTPAQVPCAGAAFRSRELAESVRELELHEAHRLELRPLEPTGAATHVALEADVFPTAV